MTLGNKDQTARIKALEDLCRSMAEWHYKGRGSHQAVTDAAGKYLNTWADKAPTLIDCICKGIYGVWHASLPDPHWGSDSAYEILAQQRIKHIVLKLHHIQKDAEYKGNVQLELDIKEIIAAIGVPDVKKHKS